MFGDGPLVNLKLVPWVYQKLARLSELLYPPLCLLCGARSGRQLDLCLPCQQDLPWNTSACSRCALPLPTTAAGQICGACQRQPPPFDHATAAFVYEFPLDRLIVGLKFQRRLHHARMLGELLAQAIQMRAPTLPEALVPVPLHPQRLQGRGYNQALEIARPLGRALGIPVVNDLCRRTRATAEQSQLSAAERRRNLRGAFSVHGPCPSHVAIVDDVHTTGSTLAEIALMLRQAGAQHVEAWSCARASHQAMPNTK